MGAGKLAGLIAGEHPVAHASSDILAHTSDDEIRRLLSELRRRSSGRTLPVVATRRGVTAIPKPKGKRYYLVPEKELLRSDAA